MSEVVQYYKVTWSHEGRCELVCHCPGLDAVVARLSTIMAYKSRLIKLTVEEE